MKLNTSCDSNIEIFKRSCGNEGASHGPQGERQSGTKRSAFHKELATCGGCGCDIVDYEKCCQRSFRDGRYWHVPALLTRAPKKPNVIASARDGPRTCAYNPGGQPWRRPYESSKHERHSVSRIHVGRRRALPRMAGPHLSGTRTATYGPQFCLGTYERGSVRESPSNCGLPALKLKRGLPIRRMA